MPFDILVHSAFTPKWTLTMHMSTNKFRRIHCQLPRDFMWYRSLCSSYSVCDFISFLLFFSFLSPFSRFGSEKCAYISLAIFLFVSVTTNYEWVPWSHTNMLHFAIEIIISTVAGKQPRPWGCCCCCRCCFPSQKYTSPQKLWAICW